MQFLPQCTNDEPKYLVKENSHTCLLRFQYFARDFYVNDEVTSIERAERVIHLEQEKRKLSMEGGHHLHKFLSNNSAVVQGIPSACNRRQGENLTFNDVPLKRNREMNSFRSSLKDHVAPWHSVNSQVTIVRLWSFWFCCPQWKNNMDDLFPKYCCRR